MAQVITATFVDGVLKPDKDLGLPPSTRVRLTVELLQDEETVRRQKAWEEVEKIWKTTTINSGGERLTRDQLHERR